MKTVGTFLKESRLKANLTLDEVARRTKIRYDYLVAIESDNFSKLPSAAFVKGFIKNYAKAVQLDPQKALAIFRRDFDHSDSGKVIPRGVVEPLATPSRVWNPRTTSLVIFGIFVLILIGYAIYQVRIMISAPLVELYSPESNQVFETNDVLVEGKTSIDALVRVNNQVVMLDNEGEFSTTLNLSQGDHTIVVETESRDGKTRQATRHITVIGQE